MSPLPIPPLPPSTIGALGAAFSLGKSIQAQRRLSDGVGRLLRAAEKATVRHQDVSIGDRKAIATQLAGLRIDYPTLGLVGLLLRGEAQSSVLDELTRRVAQVLDVNDSRVSNVRIAEVYVEQIERQRFSVLRPGDQTRLLFEELRREFNDLMAGPARSCDALGLSVTVGPDEATFAEGWKLWLPSWDSEVTEFPEEYRGWRAAQSFLKAHGAMDYGSSRLSLDVVNPIRHALHITAIRATVLSREPREPGIQVFSPTSGEASIIPCLIDLDSEVALGMTARHAARRTSESYAPWFDGFVPDRQLVATAAPGEYLPIRLVVKTRLSICKWRLELDITDGASRHTLTLPNDDSSFCTACPDDRDQVFEWGWWSRTPRMGPHDTLMDLSQRDFHEGAAGEGPAGEGA